MASTHPARAVLEASAEGRFPPADGRVEAMRPDERGTWAIVEFTGHAFVLSDRPPGDALFDGVDAFGGVTRPRFVLALAGARTDIGSHGGAGRSLILAGLATVPPDQFVFAQVAPGNAA